MESKIPLELLESIVSFVDSPRDLLSLATTSKALYAIVVPNHLEYRLIHCDFARQNVWETLCQRPGLTSQVLYLEIIDEGDLVTCGFKQVSIAPQSLVGEITNGEAEEVMNDYLTPAIKLMPNLKRFRWDVHDSQTRPNLRLLNAVCLTCPHIEEVELLLEDGGDSTFTADQDCAEVSEWPIWNLKSLRRFALSEWKFGGSHTAGDYQPAVRKLAQMIAAQNLLEDLHLHLNRSGYTVHDREEHRTIQHVFKTTVWPNLRRVTVDDRMLVGVEQEFFAAHPNLEALKLADIHHSPHDVNYGNIPALKSLDLDWNPVASPGAQTIPERLLGSLEHLRIYLNEQDMYDLHQEEPPVINRFLVRHARNLKTLIVNTHSTYKCDELRALTTTLSKLERLALTLNGDFDFPQWPLKDPRRLTTVLAALPNLTHLYHIDLISWRDAWQQQTEPAEDEVADLLRFLSAGAPKLKFVAVMYPCDNYWEGRPTWLTIIRGPNGQYEKHEPTPYYGFEGDVDLRRWSGIYYGVEGPLERTIR